MPYGNVSYSGTPPVGNNPGNTLTAAMMRLFGGQRGGQTQYGSPEAEMAMARMLGLVQGEGQPPPMERRTMGGMGLGMQMPDDDMMMRQRSGWVKG